MKTQETNKLAFKRNAIVELDMTAMRKIAGGADTNDGPTTFICGDCVVVTRQLGHLNQF
ncbi:MULTISPECIES: class I lanthipeptide [Flavobacterium]|uniref:class I lanthipeptide n=1 Tax=Flavobacterium TaxID=237 RepID=UPI0015AFC6EB|nr:MULTISPECIES: class I lanthipeptide [Flavobacterium]MBN9283333.1 class I lanthipeptide [Flavobacterium sp.]